MAGENEIDLGYYSYRALERTFPIGEIEDKVAYRQINKTKLSKRRKKNKNKKTHRK